MQRKYITNNREPLSICKSVHEFRTLLLGHTINVFTNHKNLIYPTTTFFSDCVLRQRLLVKEYGAHLHYIKGENNVVVDALSRLPTSSSPDVHQVFATNKVSYPISFSLITTSQDKLPSPHPLLSPTSFVFHPKKILELQNQTLVLSQE